MAPSTRARDRAGSNDPPAQQATGERVDPSDNLAQQLHAEADIQVEDIDNDDASSDGSEESESDDDDGPEQRNRSAEPRAVSLDPIQQAREPSAIPRPYGADLLPQQ